MSLKHLNLGFLVVLVLVGLAACNRTIVNQPEQLADTIAPNEAIRTDSTKRLWTYGFEINPETQEVVSSGAVARHSGLETGLETQELLSGADLDFSFSNVQFSTTTSPKTLSVDFNFTNKTDKAFAYLYVKQNITSSTPAGQNAVFKSSLGDMPLNVKFVQRVPVADLSSCYYLAPADAVSTNDSFVMTFSMEYTTSPVSFYIDLEAPGTTYIDPNVLYVNTENPNLGDGTSWQTPFKYLQDALKCAKAGQDIWVAEGSYYPDDGRAQTNNNRNETFQLKNGVSIYGGFAGTERWFNRRNPATNLTILSGEIQQDRKELNNSDHVTTGSGTDSTALLDGFTIKLGRSSNYSTGAGMYNNAGSPKLVNIIFSGNAAVEGGGMYNNFSSPTLTNVSFSGNTASIEGGGGMKNWNSSPILTNVSFSSNVGGGMINYNSFPTIQNSIFFANTISGNVYSIINRRNSHPRISYTFFDDAVIPADSINGGNNLYGQTDPFIDANGADNKFGTADDNLELKDTSSAIDAGNNAADLDGSAAGTRTISNVFTDLAGNTRKIDNTAVVDTGSIIGDNPDADLVTVPIVDMGAYENQSNPPVVTRLTVTTTGGGTVTSTPTGIDCGYYCVFDFDEGIRIMLDAVADSGSEFLGWVGCDISSGSNCRVSLSEAKTVTANFAATDCLLPLTAGDIAIIEVTTFIDSFQFVALCHIPANTLIRFTNKGWFSNAFQPNSEGFIDWRSPSVTMAGTVVSYSEVASLPNFSGRLLNLSEDGDQVFAFVGRETNPTFLFAVQTNSTVFQTTITGNSSDNNQSELPRGLTVGTTAVAVGAGVEPENEFDNSSYTGLINYDSQTNAVSGTKAEFLADIGDSRNWSGSNGYRPQSPTKPYIVQ